MDNPNYLSIVLHYEGHQYAYFAPVRFLSKYPFTDEFKDGMKTEALDQIDQIFAILDKSLSENNNKESKDV